jgi:hypothetical protein
VDQTKVEDDEVDETVEDEKGTPITSTFTNELKVKIADEVPWIDLASPLTQPSHHRLT